VLVADVVPVAAVPVVVVDAGAAVVDDAVEAVPVPALVVVAAEPSNPVVDEVPDSIGFIVFLPYKHKMYVQTGPRRLPHTLP